MELTYVKTGDPQVNMAYSIAVSDVVANIKPYRSKWSGEERPVMIAGMGYEDPWTRDAAINVMNGGGLLFPEISRNTLLSVLKRDQVGRPLIDGQYWDKIIWVLGAWHLYLITADRDFLELAYEAGQNTMDFLEKTEFAESLFLFRGAACYGDGVAAYPDRYVAADRGSGILSYAEEQKRRGPVKGEGLPMYALSTNCLYYRAYVLLDLMARELGKTPVWEQKASCIREAINALFWMEERGLYRYLVDEEGGCESAEGLGQAFAVLFGVADPEKKELIFARQPVTPWGIACVDPAFERYKNQGAHHYGRHSGTVWPHIQAFWADAAARNGKYDIFQKEFSMLTRVSVRDGFFAEIYHPETGEIYGGLQESGGAGITLWESQKKQTWSATGYLRMLLGDIAGIRLKGDGIAFSPFLPEGMETLEISNLHIRGNRLTIKIRGKGNRIRNFAVNGAAGVPYMDYGGNPEKQIEIEVSP